MDAWAAQSYFSSRHGKNHSIPPHLINYQANIWALHLSGVKNLIGINTVGSIETEFMPGDFVFPNQIIDYTYCRNNTFFDGIKICSNILTLPFLLIIICSVVF